MSLASLASASGARGATMGAFQASASLARVIGPVAAGWLYDAAQPAPFVLASALVLAVAAQARSLPAEGAGPLEEALAPPGAA
jgi:MFS family permease